jgi:acetylglutamate kinase
MLAFFIYWNGMLNPVLKALDKTSADLDSIKIKLNQPMEVDLMTSGSTLEIGLSRVTIAQKEAQISKVLQFMDRKFRWFGIDMVNLKQSAKEHVLVLDYTYKCTYYQFKGMINALSQIDTVIVIDSVGVNQEGDKLNVQMRLISGYL